MSHAGYRASNHPLRLRRGNVDRAADSWATDPRVFAALDARLGPFTLDVAASLANAKCRRFYSIDEDGLTSPWTGETVWCNPPFSNVRPWVEKAWHEHSRCRAIAMLIPANRTEQPWWQELVEPRRDRPGSALTVEFLPGRPRFVAPGAARIGPHERPPFGCCLLIWHAPRQLVLELGERRA